LNYSITESFYKNFLLLSDSPEVSSIHYSVYLEDVYVSGCHTLRIPDLALLIRSTAVLSGACKLYIKICSIRYSMWQSVKATNSVPVIHRSGKMFCNLLFNDAVSALYYIASNYLMVVIIEPQNMRRRRTTICLRLGRWCPSRRSIRLRLK
jgi:hypothetical protein